MRRIIICLAVFLFSGLARGQDLKPDDVKKHLDAALAELKNAQDYKAQLASQVSELVRVNQIQAEQINDLKRQAAAFADRTLFLSAQYALWTQFLNLNPAVRVQWAIFEDANAAADAGQSPFFMDTNWPLPAKGK